MIDNKELNIDVKEVLRYLNVMGKTKGEKSLDKELENRICACKEKLLEVSRIKYIYRDFDLNVTEDVISFADVSVFSKSLFANLKGCKSCYLFAVTIGPGADILRQRADVTSPADSLIYQAVAATMVESAADIVNDKIRESAALNNMSTRPRFSPGYGDFTLEYQRDFERLLNMSKETGITLTDSLLMAPSKSVTAIVGAYINAGE